METESYDSDKTYTLKDLDGDPKFVGTVKDWDEFHDFLKTLETKNKTGYIILKSDSNQYFGKSGHFWIDISKAYLEYLKIKNEK